MIEPTVTPRIKQRDNLTRSRIDAGQVRTSAKVAAVTRKGQIAVVIGPAMLAGHDMLDVMGKRTTVLRKEAILATVPGSGRTSIRVADSIVKWRRKAAHELLISELPRNPPR